MSKTKYDNFHVPFLVDETLREGVERCQFPISTEDKLSLLKEMTKVGLREFIVGCGPEKPEVWEGLFQLKEKEELPNDTEATFIILLNCWETAYQYFHSLSEHKHWIEDTVFSFGMINYKESEKTFEKAIAAFKSLGAKKFKASILNNFRSGYDEKKYHEICRQVDMAVTQGVGTIRINDSVGSLEPHLTEKLCSKLVQDYPDITFCLHAHNDTGLAVANAMASIQAGFQMIEGSLCGFGNRSGIAPLEQVVNLCNKKNISIGNHKLNIKELSSVARYSEKIFLQVPNVFRPVGGALEMNSNFGVLNIPDYLSVKDKKPYFVNYAGLHAVTIRMALKKHNPELKLSDDELEKNVELMKEKMSLQLNEIKKHYNELNNNIINFYESNSWTTKRLADEIVASLQN